MSAGQIGMLVGARSLLAVFLSIHVGALMDRLGTRRVALFFVWTAMALAPVFPLLPWFWPLLLLQVVNGGALQFAWSGSQTLIAQLADGEAEYLGRFSVTLGRGGSEGAGQSRASDRDHQASVWFRQSALSRAQEERSSLAIPLRCGVICVA
jgi:hypothetical protein